MDLRWCHPGRVAGSGLLCASKPLDAMRAMVLRRPGAALQEEVLPLPQPAAGEVRVRVGACGVCRTDLHVVDGELAEAKRPVIPGHEIVGRVDALGDGVRGL